MPTRIYGLRVSSICGTIIMTFYLILKALHLIAVISWMAGMLYLPRLFVYHADSNNDDTKATFKIMERRLYKFIMTPAMIATWVLGIILLIHQPYFLTQGWMHAKLLLVLLLSGAHGYMGSCVRKFAHDSNIKSSKFYRYFNEVPTILMIVIVFLVILKGF